MSLDIDILSGSREEKIMAKILGALSTGIQSLLRRVPLHLGTTNTSWDLQLGFSIFLLLLKYLSPVRRKEQNQRRHILFCILPLDRLIIGHYRTRPWRWWIFQAFHIQNFFRMFRHQLSSNVQYTPNVINLCVLADIWIHQGIQPKVDGGFHRRS